MKTVTSNELVCYSKVAQNFWISGLIWKIAALVSIKYTFTTGQIEDAPLCFLFLSLGSYLFICQIWKPPISLSEGFWVVHK